MTVAFGNVVAVQFSKIKRMVKSEDNDKGKVKQCRTIIIEEDKELLPAPPPAGKQLADLIAGLSPEDLGNVMVTCRPPLCKSGFSLLGFSNRRYFVDSAFSLGDFF